MPNTTNPYSVYKQPNPNIHNFYSVYKKRNYSFPYKFGFVRIIRIRYTPRLGGLSRQVGGGEMRENHTQPLSCIYLKSRESIMNTFLNFFSIFNKCKSQCSKVKVSYNLLNLRHNEMSAEQKKILEGTGSSEWGRGHLEGGD